MTQDSLSFEDAIYYAKLAEQAERYEDMVEYMRRVVKKDKELTLQERNLLSVAYKNTIGLRRTAWRMVSAIEKKEKYAQFRDVTTEYKNSIVQELDKICKEILKHIDDDLVPNSESDQTKVFYLKMKGDYYRYLSEVSTDDSLQEVSEGALKSYEQASQLAESLEKTHPIRLGLALNFSVFHYEVMNDQAKACELAKTAFDAGLSDLDKLDDETYKDAQTILQLLKDNLSLWTQNDEEDAGGDGTNVEEIS